jgi:hypothetical protein
MTAVYTWDVFSTLDGYGSYGPDGDWGGYWGKQGPGCEACRQRWCRRRSQAPSFGRT